MQKFKVGEEVVALEGANYDILTQALVKGKVYIVLDVYECSCGKQGVYVGIDTNISTGQVRCNNCKCIQDTKSSNAYFYSENFAPVIRKTTTYSVVVSIPVELSNLEPELN
jgi:hypothetical protein